MERSVTWSSAAVFLVATFAGVVYQWLAPFHIGPDGLQYVRAAMSIQHGDYSCSWNSSLQYCRPPGYPLILAALGVGSAYWWNASAVGLITALMLRSGRWVQAVIACIYSLPYAAMPYMADLSACLAMVASFVFGSGILAAFSVLLHPSGLFYLVVPMMKAKDRIGFVLQFVIVATPWILFFYSRTGVVGFDSYDFGFQYNVTSAYMVRAEGVPKKHMEYVRVNYANDEAKFHGMTDGQRMQKMRDSMESSIHHAGVCEFGKVARALVTSWTYQFFSSSNDIRLHLRGITKTVLYALLGCVFLYGLVVSKNPIHIIGYLFLFLASSIHGAWASQRILLAALPSICLFYDTAFRDLTRRIGWPRFS